eukprot:TRINITY_DN2347_c0_g1_i2.p3 TRINITY_DN2347_c0_g1~~TRINITY_DN2347_c0_g1_i2.p3  ORF type:complete len:119 (-),score=13.17 TRINITY_DN2347_c0_g1_i2:420-776(-)
MLGSEKQLKKFFSVDQTQQAMVKQLMGVEDIEQVLRDQNLAPIIVPELDSAINQNFHQLMTRLRKQYGRYMRLRVCKRADLQEAQFHLQLVEDRNTSGMSYVEYLCHVHRLIQNKMIY